MQLGHLLRFCKAESMLLLISKVVSAQNQGFPAQTWGFYKIESLTSMPLLVKFPLINSSIYTNDIEAVKRAVLKRAEGAYT